MPGVASGDVVQLYTDRSIPPKTKRVILIAENGDEFLGVFINTELHGTEFQKSELHEYQPFFEKNASRSYLEYGSYIDCLQPSEFSKAELMAACKRSIDNLKGAVSRPDLDDLKSLIRSAPTVVPRIKKKYKLRS